MTRKEKEEEKNQIVENCLFSWDQQPGETGGTYKLFLVFRDLGRSRSYGEIVKIIPGKNYYQINQIGSRNQWFKRAKAWDLMKEEEMSRKLDEEILYARIRQQRIGETMQVLAEKGLKMLSDYPDELTAADISKLVDIGTKIERLALGDSTSIVKSESTVEAKIAVEEIPKEISEEIGKKLAILASKKMVINV